MIIQFFIKYQYTQADYARAFSQMVYERGDLPKHERSEASEVFRGPPSGGQQRTHRPGQGRGEGLRGLHL